MKIVSQADWCFDMMTAGSFGTCSQPLTSQVMPRLSSIQRNITTV
jgi:hypothetical protein